MRDLRVRANANVCAYVCALCRKLIYLPSGVQDAKNTYLIIPPRPVILNAAGSTITYGKRKGKEFVNIPGPINETLRFMVRNTTKTISSLI